MKFLSHSAEETFKIAENFSKTLKAGDVVALFGDLGAGKTEFVKGVARALGCDEDITSPTFTLVNEYKGEDFMIYHFDVYRLSGISIDNCDWIDEYLFSDGISIVEWADNISDILPENHIRVNIEKNITVDKDYREIEIC